MAFYEVDVSARKLFEYCATLAATDGLVGWRTFEKLFYAVAKNTTQIACLSPAYMRNMNAFAVLKQLLARLEAIMVQYHGPDAPANEAWEEYLDLKTTPAQLSARLDALKEHLSAKTFCAHVCTLEAGSSPENCCPRATTTRHTVRASPRTLDAPRKHTYTSAQRARRSFSCRPSCERRCRPCATPSAASFPTTRDSYSLPRRKRPVTPGFFRLLSQSRTCRTEERRRSRQLWRPELSISSRSSTLLRALRQSRTRSWGRGRAMSDPQQRA